jgi:nicotinamide-nucleotide amidase
LSGGVVAKTRILRVAGLGESAVDEVIAPIYRGYESVETSILFNRVEIEVHLLAMDSDAARADRTLDELTHKICEKLGDAVFSTDGSTMEEVIGRLLRERRATLATAESCTGGLISMRITEVPGSSEYYMQGAVTYSNEAKIRMLGVPKEVIEEHGAVSAETAEAMAVGIRRHSGTDYAVSVTGIAGPGGGTPSKPVGTVYIGCAGPEGVTTRHVLLPGDRELVRWRASQAALDLLRRQIMHRQ